MLQFVHARLSLGARLLILGGLGLAPTALLMVLFVSQSWKDIDFARREMVGATYLQSVWPVVVDAARGQTNPAHLQALRTAARSNDAVLGTNGAAVAAIADPAERLAAAISLVGKVADTSNLTLDPDLDSFYVMDAVTVKLPAVVAAAAARDVPDLEIRGERLRAAMDGTQTDLTTAMTENATGTTRRAVGAQLPRLAAETAALRQAWRTAPDTAHTAPLLATVDQTWRAANSELLALLKARDARLMNRLSLNLGLAVFFAGLALAAGWLIAQALGRRISDLVQAMERVSSGDLTQPTPYLTDRNETGRIAAGVEGFKTALVTQQRLEIEAESERQGAERERTAAEAERRTAADAQAAVVSRLAQELSRVAGGDLTRRIETPFPTAYEPLRADFNTAIADLDRAVSAIAARVRTIESSANEISTASTDLSRRTEQQAATLEETSAVVEELTATVQRTSEGAHAAADVASRSRVRADGSSAVVQQAISAMTSIQSSSSDIGRIVGLIDEIAFQTNLLALNAGVEAARAGEAGKGFAVVALEVRALSQRSAQAAREIGALVGASTEEVERGVEMVGRTRNVIGEIAQDVTGIDGLIHDFAASAQEQAVALRQVNIAVAQMDQTTQQNAAMVEQTTAATQALHQDVRVLSQLAGRFQVTEAGARTPAKAA